MDKIAILLHEYDTLRNEIIQRNTVMFQSIGIYATVLVGLLVLISQKGMNYDFVMVAATIVFGGALVWIDVDTAKAAERVREIESIVNSQAGETLLIWETQRGLGGLLGKHLIK